MKIFTRLGDAVVLGVAELHQGVPHHAQGAQRRAAALSALLLK